jgi:hypothetical protein
MMLLLKKLYNNLEIAGYGRAANLMRLQGRPDLSADLLKEQKRLQTVKRKAIARLERVKRAKANYEPGDHYFRGKTVAFWKGHA